MCFIWSEQQMCYFWSKSKKKNKLLADKRKNTNQTNIWGGKTPFDCDGLGKVFFSAAAREHLLPVAPVKSVHQSNSCCSDSRGTENTHALTSSLICLMCNYSINAVSERTWLTWIIIHNKVCVAIGFMWGTNIQNMLQCNRCVRA